MFAVIKKVKVRKRRFGKTVFPLPERYTAATGFPYYVLPLPVIDGKPDWEYTSGAAGGCAGRIIVPEGLEPPEGCGLDVYFPERFASEAVFEAAVRLLEKSDERKNGLTVTVYDPRALLSGEVWRLPEVSARVRIVTENAGKYEFSRKKAMELFGASLVFCGSTRESDAVLTAVSARPPGGEYKILSLRGRPITAPAALPEGVKKPDCPGLDNLVFCGALSELCGVNIAPSELFRNG